MTGDSSVVVLITHRLAFTATAEHLYVLDQDHNAEGGARAALMHRRGGLYRSKYEAQAAQHGHLPTPRPARDSLRTRGSSR